MTGLVRRLGIPLVVGTLALGLGRGVAAQNIPVTVGGQASSLVGVPFDLPVTIDMASSGEVLGSFALSVRWNPAVLEFVSGEVGDFGSVSANDDSLAAGVLLLAGANPSGVAGGTGGGQITVAWLRLRPLIADTTTLEVNVTEIYAAGTFADLSAAAVPTSRQYCPALGRFGDVDGDGAANSRDALIALSASVGLDVSAFNVAMGDVDGNAATEARDALIILSYAVGLDVSAFQIFHIAPGACAAGIGRPALYLDPGDVTVSVGQELFYQVVGLDSATGEPVVLTNAFWSSSDEAVAAIGPSGHAVAVGPGTATITASVVNDDTVSANLTVSPTRGVYWVDALAAGARNQLGDSAHPFGTIQSAVDIAGTGDTVRVRPGRYEEVVYVDHGVAIEGDTSMGGLRPLLAQAPSEASGFLIDGSGRVEVRNFRTDTLDVGVNVYRADTVVVDNVEFRMRRSGYAGILADTVGALIIRRSRLFGPATSYGYGVLVDRAGLVAVDSSLVTGFGDDGISLNNVDSLDLRDNVIRDNDGWGLYVCTACYTSDSSSGVRAVLRRNRLTGSYYGQISMDLVRSASFERNVFVGGGGYYDAVLLYGHSGSTVSFLADSFDVYESTWLDVNDYDSLLVDSVVVVQRDAYGYMYGGRTATIRDSRFLELSDYALEIEGTWTDTTLVQLQNVEFSGPDSSVCDRCGQAVYGYYTSIIADSVTGQNLNYGFQLDYSQLALTNSTFDHMYSGVDLYCGSVALTAVSVTDGQYGVYQDGCIDEDTVSIDGSQFQYLYRGLYAYDGAVQVTGSSFRDIDYPIETSCANVTLLNDTLSNGYNGWEVYGCYSGGLLDTAIADGLWIEQMQSYGVYGSTMDLSITNSVLTSNVSGIDLTYGNFVASDNQVSGTSSDVIYLNGDTYGSVVAERNTVTCDPVSGYYGIRLYAYNTDSTIARDNVLSDCRTALYADGSFTEARGNSVTIPVSLRAVSENGLYAAGDSSLSVVGNSVTGPARYGSIEVTRSDRGHVDSNTVSQGIEAGIYVGYVDSLWVRDNLITAQDTSSCCISEPSGGILLTSVATNVAGFAQVSGNRIISDSSGVLVTTRPSGIVLYRYPGDTVTVQVDSNVTIGGYYGVLVTYYARAAITRNAIDTSWVDGIRVDRSSADSTAVVAHDNNFTRNAGYGVRALDGVNGWVDATNNWWNDALGPSGAYGDTMGLSVGDSVSLDVRWDPWLATPFGGAPVPAPSFLVAAQPNAEPGLTIRPLWPAGPLRGSLQEPQASHDVSTAPVTAVMQALPVDAPAAVRDATARRYEWMLRRAEAQRLEAERRSQRDEQRAAARAASLARRAALMIEIREREDARREREQGERRRQ